MDFDHKDLIATLTETERANVLEKSDRAGLLHLAGHLIAIGLCSTLILWRVPYYPLVMLPQGILIVFLFTALHETIHKTAFASIGLNDAVAKFCGFMVFLPPDWFRFFHFAHHRYTHDPERDPELEDGKPNTRLRYFLAMTGLAEWISRVRLLVKNALFETTASFVPGKGRVKVRREARFYCLCYAAIGLLGIWGGWRDILLVWIVPLLVGGPFLRAYLLAEHNLCPHVPNMLKNTRTTYTNAVVRLLAWNMPYHIEHHVYPAVPFHKLPDFHKVAKAHLGCTEDGYIRFNRAYFKSLDTPKHES